MKTIFSRKRNKAVPSVPKLVMVCASAFFYLVPGSQAALLSYEGFNYTAGTSIVGQNGGTGFSQAWQLNNSGGQRSFEVEVKFFLNLTSNHNLNPVAIQSKMRLGLRAKHD